MQIPQLGSKIDSSEYADLNRVVSWFILLRWIAVFGVLITLFLVRFRLAYHLPFNLLYLLTGILCLINLLFTLYYIVIKSKNLSRRGLSLFLHVQIICDYVLLFFLIYFTGFLENPFAYFFVFHIMLTSFLFSPDIVFVYVGALIVVFIGAFFAEYLRVIPHYSLSDSVDPHYFRLYLPRAIGICSTLAISAYLITNIKRRIAEKGRRVEVELNRYKELDRIKSNFILQVTHELRGPIAAMNGYHEMLIRGIGGKIAPRANELVHKANRRTENLLQIIDEMIDYAYMKSEEEVRYTKTALSVREIIDYQLDIHSGQAVQKNIDLVCNCPKELQIYSNRDLLNIIFSNLINNAIKYSPESTRITVNAVAEKSVAEKSVAVKAGTEAGEIHLIVKDQGYGIEPEELEKIFEEFYRTRKARELERDGTGLGLPIVQRAVESLGGRLTVYSELGKGTTFHIFLPAGGENEQNSDH
ncbi:MAG: HAMP domain-containing histidine kinase [Spirochaetaceae bacterium]|nr:MAG: HAMP domain-containing histidine kinase [Spirochaetaceae bacterium]